MKTVSSLKNPAVQAARALRDARERAAAAESPSRPPVGPAGARAEGAVSEPHFPSPSSSRSMSPAA